MSPQHIGHDQAVTRPILSDTGGSLAYRWCRSVEWKPSPVIALATSVDDARVAAAREDGSIEIWLVSPGSVGWHCQLTMQGDAGKRVSSLVWSAPGSKKDAPSGRLFSSSVDGSISEWDLYNLKVKTALESIGVSIWQMALQPQNKESVNHENGSLSNGNGVVIDRYSDASESSSSDDETDSAEIDERCLDTNSLLAVACDDGSVRLYKISDADELIYSKSLPRVGGRTLSVAWSPDGRMIYSGSSDGLIRCWDMKWGRELYRITVGLGGLGSGPELCVWSLLALRSGDLVSADSTGTVQFWDAEHGTLLQAHSLHKGDVNALAADPAHNRVFSGGSDGQVILYSLSSSSGESNNAASSSAGVMKKWRYIGYHRPHTHDVRALTVAVPISQEDSLPEVKVKRSRQQKKPKGSNYLKWAHVGVPMLISGGDDTKLFAYSAKEYTKFSAHDFCPAPQRLPVHVVPKSVFNQMPLLLVQSASSVEILTLREKDTALGEKESGSILAHPVVRVNKGSEKIICSSISPSGSWFAFSNHVKPSLFQLKRCESTNKWSIQRMKLPSILPYAHSMIFTSDSSRLIVAGHDKRIYVIDADNLKLLHIFTPRRKVEDEDVPPSEPPMTKMFVSSDGQWLAVANCFGDIYIFNLEVQRQHWFITRLDGASVTAGGFHPHHSNVLVITTSTNQLYEFDVEAKQLGEWSRKNSLHLPAEFLEFPGEIIGLSFSPSTGGSSSLVIYSSRAMCSINFALPVSHGGGGAYKLSNGLDAISKKLIKSPINGKLKRKLQEHDLGHQSLHERNFKFKDFNDPVLFAGHLSRSSMLVLYRPWLDVVKNFDVQPVHRHIYGT